MARIEIDEHSGFCFGVVTAIRKAEEELDRTGRLYCLGDIVHNSNEVERLKAKGLITIDHEQLKQLHDVKVLLRAHGEPPETYRIKGLITIDHEQLKQLHDVKVLLRAHGEPPETYRIAAENNIEIIDATCPVVLQLQRKIKTAYDSNPPGEAQIVIYGKTGHAEVNGLVGQTHGKAVVIEGDKDLDKIDLRKKLLLYSQTTKSVEGFRHIVDEIKQLKPDGQFESFDTICRQVANRIPNIREFARRHDLILFVCGKKSSNGRVLFGECLQVNPQSRLVSDISEIDPTWLEGKESIGICGATSTPRWLMTEVQEYITRLLETTGSTATR